MDADFIDCKQIMEISEDCCLFCRAILSADIKIDIQDSTTEQGRVNVEEFIKNSVLGLETEIKLEGQFLCDLCFKTLNKLEDYLQKSKDIQQKLLNTYLQGRKEMLIKVEPKDNAILALHAYNDDDQAVETLESEDMDTQIKEETKLKSTTTASVKRQRRIKKCLIESGTDSVRRQRRTGKRKAKSKSIPADDGQPSIETKTEEKQEQKHCCEICGKVTNKGNAAKHMNIHTKKQLFICEYCNKNFTQKVDLRRHLNIHMGIFPYVCEFCGKKFAQHTSYDIHKKNHLGKRDFKCIICDKGLLSKSHLVRHMKTHTSEKNYSCDICGKTFAEKYNRTSHMKKVHLKQSIKMSESIQNTVNVDSGEVAL